MLGLNLPTSRKCSKSPSVSQVEENQNKKGFGVEQAYTTSFGPRAHDPPSCVIPDCPQ